MRSSKSMFVRDIGDVLFKKSRRAKKINISIKPFEGIVVSFPYYVSYKVAEEAVVSKKSWIINSISKMKNYESKIVVFNELSDFSTRSHKLIIQRKVDGNISVTIRNKNIYIKYPSDVLVNSEEVQSAIRIGIERALRIEAKDYLPIRVNQLAREFDFSYNQVYCKNLKSRWGSCSVRNNINLNIHLMRLDDEFIDYVILHELCHTIHKNHSKRFWDKLESVFQGAKSVDKKLREFSTRTIT